MDSLKDVLLWLARRVPAVPADLHAAEQAIERHFAPPGTGQEPEPGPPGTGQEPEAGPPGTGQEPGPGAPGI